MLRSGKVWSTRPGQYVGRSIGVTGPRPAAGTSGRLTSSLPGALLLLSLALLPAALATSTAAATATARSRRLFVVGVTVHGATTSRTAGRTTSAARPAAGAGRRPRTAAAAT